MPASVVAKFFVCLDGLGRLGMVLRAGRDLAQRGPGHQSAGTFGYSARERIDDGDGDGDGDEPVWSQPGLPSWGTDLPWHAESKGEGGALLGGTPPPCIVGLYV